MSPQPGGTMRPFQNEEEEREKEKGMKRRMKVEREHFM